MFYGTKSVLLTSKNLSEECPHCQTQGSVLLNVYQRYFHATFIPFFPLNKYGSTICTHCKQVLINDWNYSGFKPQYLELKKTSKTPWWTFSGLVLLIAFFVWLYIIGKEQKGKELTYVNSPKRGDVYEIQNEASNYTLFRIDSVSQDQVWIKTSLYESTTSKGLNKIKAKGEEGYSMESTPISRAELVKMFEANKVYGVNRAYN